MNRKIGLVMSLILGATFLGTRSEASLSDFTDRELNEFAITDRPLFATPVVHVAKWEFGVYTGYWVPVGRKSTGLYASHSVFLLSDPDFPGEDEFAENGYATPDFEGHSTINGEYRSAFSVGMHVYRHLTPAVSVGVESLFTPNISATIKEAGAFQVPLYILHYKTQVIQAVPTVRLGRWLGNVRPYVSAGVGPLYINEKVTADLNDPDDPNHSPLVAARRDDAYFSTLLGAGVDVNFFDEGSVGLAVQYGEAFTPGEDFAFVIPSARFVYHF